MSRIRVLVVEDHEVVRRRICALLATDPILDIIWQAADSEEAVSKAEELHPDLILLDISLPGLSGIEAARRIRDLSPSSQIIFLSQHEVLQIVREAFSTGAQGFVVKLDASSDLHKAIQAVRSGKKFVSQRIVSQGLILET